MQQQDVEKQYEELAKQGQANVENIVQWLKQANVLQAANKTEEEAATMLTGAGNEAQVSQEKFTQVITELAASAQMTSEQIYSQLYDVSSRLMGALQQAGAALTSSLADKLPSTSK